MNGHFDPQAGRPMDEDCWNRIGVWGDGRCPELRSHTHCRNCPVYAAAAAALLDSAAPAGYLQARTEHYAAPLQPVVGRCDSVLIFRLKGEWLALPTAAFVEVAAMRPLHGLPHRRGGIVLGLVNVRGALLICLSLSAMLGMETTQQNQPELLDGMPRMLVLGYANELVAVPVDEVAGMHRFHTGDLKPAPATLARDRGAYVKAVLAWDGRTVGLLDEELMFHTVNRSLA